MKIALIQTNPLVGDCAGNVRSITNALTRAHQAQCSLAVFPELALCGYPPQDLLERASFLEAHERALAELLEFTQTIKELTCVLGGLGQADGPGKSLYNTAFVLHNGTILAQAHKRLLPDYDVFDDTRHFAGGRETATFACGRLYCALTISEDLWWQEEKHGHNPLDDFMLGSIVPDLLINIAASPYHFGKRQERRKLFASICTTYNLPLVYVNQAGGQDSLVFDGHSLAMSSTGEMRAQAAGFSEDMLVVDFPAQIDVPAFSQPDEHIGDLAGALVCGLRDYVRKSGFSKAIIGLSGGIDSALTAALACQALGADNLLGVALPSPYTSEQSIEDARQLALNLGCAFECIPIQPAMDVYAQILDPFFTGLPSDVTEQNIQARIRGNLLMALANKFNRLLLSTGNKSEVAVGYCTLYGDMCGALAVLADVYKTQVYELSHWINRNGAIIPQSTIIRPPTAELKPGQLDQDDLPPYAVLDPILQAYLEKGETVAAIAAGQQVDLALVRDIIRRIRRSEHKRVQASLNIRVSRKAFGLGRRVPVIQGFYE